jgi:hypothetical protein
MTRGADIADVVLERYAMPSQCLESQPYGARGTIGIIGVDTYTGRPVAITAMHVIPGITEYPSVAHPSDVKFESPCLTGSGTIIGRLLRGTMRGIDAAVIDIGDEAVSNWLPDVGPVEYWRSVDDVSDRDATVRMVGAVSGRQYGRIVKPNVRVPNFDLESAILVEMSARHGDSGAPLVDERGWLIGLLVGGTSSRQFFCPIESVFHRLSCQLFQG